MIDLSTGIVTLEYDGSNNSKILGFSVNNLVVGAYYSFYVYAKDFNGLSVESESVEFVVCLAPTHIYRPNYIESTTTSFTLSWTKPENMGGCPVLSYAIYMNESSGNFVEIDSLHIRNKPYLTKHTFEGLL